jgi:predicted transcriptional regulator of viral defense system
MIRGTMNNVLVSALENYPVFTVKDIAGAINKKMNYAYLVAFRLKKSGVIKEIEKGKYTLENDPFVLASWIVWPSYISGWAALFFHKLTEQIPFTIHVVSTRKRKQKKIFFNGTKIEFIQIKKTAFTGFERIVYQGKEIFLAEKEKAIVDALSAKKMSINEAIELIKNNKGKLNMKKLLGYSKNIIGMKKKLECVFN